MNEKSRKKGKKGKELASLFFKQLGWGVRDFSSIPQNPIDLIVEDGEDYYGVVVKYGDTYFLKSKKMEKMLLKCKKDNLIPSFFLINNNKEFAFFVYKELI